MFGSIHPIQFFVLTLALFTFAALLGWWFESRHTATFKQEELSVKTLVGASLGLFGVMLGFTFAMANSRFEERRQLEIAEAIDLGNLWVQTSLLAEPLHSLERNFLRQYLAVRIRFTDSGPDGPACDASVAESGKLQTQMWRVANEEFIAHRDPSTTTFLKLLSDSIDATEKRAAAFENLIPGLSWGILLLLGMMACALLGVDLKSRSLILRGLLQVALAAALALTYDIDTPRKGFVQVSEQSMLRVQTLMNAAPNN
jgi:hypothetical protein